MTTYTPQQAPVVRHQKLGFRADIQGLRAIAVLLVVIYHSGVPALSGGYIGVDVFFVISGFLITTHLLESLAREGNIQLGQFYAKRARRILPASLTVLILTVIAGTIWLPPLQVDTMVDGAIYTALYIPNIFFALEGTNYLAETAPSVFQHYWSLGIEEQFYLVWPLALILVHKITKSERLLFWIVSGLVVSSFAVCVMLTPISQSWTFFSLPTRAWELGAGALMAFVMRSHSVWLSNSKSGILAWIGVLALLILSLTYNSNTPFPSYFAAAPVLATTMIIAGGVGQMSPSRLLSVKPLQFVGLISYSVYLVHWPMLVIPQAASGSGNPLPLQVTLLLGLLSFPVAYALYHFVEDPVRKYKPLVASKPIVTFSAVAAITGVVIAGTIGAGKYETQQPLHANMSTPSSTPKLLPEGTGFVPSNLNPSLRSAVSDNSLLYSNGCHRNNDSIDASGCQFGSNKDAPLVALFGDSHAASWFPALHGMAKEGKIRLDVNTKSSCPSINVPTTIYGHPYYSCDKWRNRVTDRLKSQRPVLVVIANRPALALENGSIDSSDDWGKATGATVKDFSMVSEVAVIADVPDMGATPAICLSANLDDADECARPRGMALEESIASVEQHAAQSNGAAYLNFNDYMCNSNSCPAVIGNELVYRDAHHLTATFSASLQIPVARQIESLL